jgi:hypothetical protein
MGQMKNYLMALCFIAGLGIASIPNAQAQSSSSTAIVSLQTNSCWDVQNYSTADGAIIQMWPCTGTSNQAWAYQVYGYNSDYPLARIVNVNSGLCVAAESSNPASGAIGLIQRVCNVNDPNQQWQIDQPYVQMVISSGSNAWVVHSLAASRHFVNIASHWCVRTDDTFFRPILTSSCGANDDNHSRYKTSGI